jgi:multiple sugar transport system substrate-binding protein
MAFEDEVVDMRDVAEALESSFGAMLPQAKHSLYNPQTQKWTGISDHWVPMVSNWRKDLWEQAEPNSSPNTWEDVLRVGRKLKQNGHPIGMGLSTDLDSNVALSGLLSAYGSVIQDPEGVVTVNSKETIAALQFGRSLFKETMQSEVLAWNASSNNQFLLGESGSYAMNAASITRVAEKDNPSLANKIAISTPPAGPVQRIMPANVVSVYTVWKFSKQIELAKQFVKDLILEAETAFEKGELYNYPSFPGAVKNLEDAYKKEEKYAFLSTAPEWSCNMGYPGNANAVTNEIFDNYLIPKAFSLVAVETLTAKQGALWLQTEVN